MVRDERFLGPCGNQKSKAQERSVNLAGGEDMSHAMLVLMRRIILRRAEDFEKKWRSEVG